MNRDNRFYNLHIAKILMKCKSDSYLFEVNKDEIGCIINEIKKISDCITFIETKDPKVFVQNVYSCCNSNIKCIINHIKNQEYNLLDQYLYNAENSNGYYIYFIYNHAITEEVKRLDNYRDYLNNFNYSRAYNIISKYYRYKTFCFYFGDMYLIFSDEENKINISYPDVIVAILGIGDAFIIFSLLYGYLKKIKELDKSCFLLSDTTIGFKNLKDFLGLPIFNYNNEKKLSILINNYNGKYINTLDYITTLNNIHIFDLWKNALEYSIDDPYEYNYIIKMRLSDLIDPCEKKEIDEKIAYGECIGIQFFTRSYSEEQKNSLPSIRNWDEENVNRFIELAVAHKMKVVVLTPHDYSLKSSVISVAENSVYGFIYAISKMKLVIGIDSSAGHIASFYNIPTITLWGASTPLHMEIRDYKIGFRVLRNNLSVVSQKEDIKDITGDFVFSIVKNINEYDFDKNKIITYEDSINGYNIMTI